MKCLMPQSTHTVAIATFWRTFLGHSIMMEKLAQPGKVGGEGCGARPPLFTINTIMYKVVVYAPAKRAETLLLFLLYSFLYTVFDAQSGQLKGKSGNMRHAVPTRMHPY